MRVLLLRTCVAMCIPRPAQETKHKYELEERRADIEGKAGKEERGSEPHVPSSLVMVGTRRLTSSRPRTMLTVTRGLRVSREQLFHWVLLMT
jgi:hypothetical protein